MLALKTRPKVLLRIPSVQESGTAKKAGVATAKNTVTVWWTRAPKLISASRSFGFVAKLRVPLLEARAADLETVNRSIVNVIRQIMDCSSEGVATARGQ